MEVFEAIKKRRSIRKYKPDKIPEKDLKEILEAARLAPSAHNWQPWRFIIVRDEVQKKLVGETALSHQLFVGDAGSIVVAIADPGARPTTGKGARPKSYWVNRNVEWFKMDVMIAIEHMVLTAESLGYGTCWIGTFEEEQVKRILDIPEEMTVVALLPIGVPNEESRPRSIKDFSEIFYGEKYGENINL